MRDEHYILGICDEVLRCVSIRQHRFSFLVGDSGVRLPVDAFYPELSLVIEYRERQHSEPVALFDRKHTVSGVPRGQQRLIYDQRRRDILPKHGITLVEFCYSEFLHGARKCLQRVRDQDLIIVQERLAALLSNNALQATCETHAPERRRSTGKASKNPMKTLAVILAICFVPAAFASSAEQFRAGVLGLSWGITLQQAQSAYPGGLAWPVQGQAVNGGVIYAIPGSDRMLGLSTPVRFVQLLFNKKNELQAVFFHFSYEDRDSALYDTGVLLGQEYSTKEKGDVRAYNWKLGELTIAQLQVGASDFQPWVQLVFHGTKFAKADCKWSCP